MKNYIVSSALINLLTYNDQHNFIMDIICSLTSDANIPLHISSYLSSPTFTQILSNVIDDFCQTPIGFRLTYLGNKDLIIESIRAEIKKRIIPLIPQFVGFYTSSISTPQQFNSRIIKMIENSTSDMTDDFIAHLIQECCQNQFKYFILWGNLVGIVAGILTCFQNRSFFTLYKSF